jgi:uncharacterized membrane protein YqaE (UPF0057 family)
MLSVLAVACPPLAVALAEKKGSRVALNVGLTMLLFLPGVLHALAVVERRSVGRRYESVMRVLDRRAA